MLKANKAPAGHLWAVVHIVALRDELLNPFAASRRRVRKSDSQAGADSLDYQLGFQSRIP